MFYVNFSYTTTGIYKEVDGTTLRIMELPIRKWTDNVSPVHVSTGSFVTQSLSRRSTYIQIVPDLFDLLSLFTIKPILFAWNLITSGYFELSVYGVEVLWDFSVSRLKFCYGLRQDISMVFAKWKICIDFICLQGMGLIDPRFPLFSCCPRIRYYLSTCF